MGNELEEEIYRTKANIESGKHNIERIKGNYKRELKTFNAYVKQQKLKLSKLEKKYFSKKRD